MKIKERDLILGKLESQRKEKGKVEERWRLARFLSEVEEEISAEEEIGEAEETNLSLIRREAEGAAATESRNASG